MAQDISDDNRHFYFNPMKCEAGRALGEHIVVTECSVGWNADHITARLKDSHDCSTCIVRSGDTGDIVDRTRKVGVSLNKHKACVLCVSCVVLLGVNVLC